MSLTREVLSISRVSLKDAFEEGLSVKTINPLEPSEDDKPLLARFFKECVSTSQHYIERGPWLLDSLSVDNVKTLRCIRFTAPMLLHPAAAYPTHLRVEVIGEKVGAGNFGAVYKVLGTLALQASDDVSIKKRFRIVKQQSHRAASIREIERESELGIQAGYLHMKIPVHCNGVSYTVSRYFAGAVEVFNIIDQLYRRNDCYSTDKILHLVWNILRAVKSQLHDRGVISRDIKPENILVNVATDEVFNIDLGLAKSSGEGNYKESMGSLGYFSPEVFSKSGMTAKSDIFSLAVTVSLLLGASFNNSELEFNGDKRVVLPSMERLFFHTPDLNEFDRAALREMLNSMMATDPDVRMPLKQAISIVEGVILRRKTATMSESIRDEVGRAYALAVQIRADIDLAESAMISYFSMDPFDVVEQLVKKLKVIAADGLSSLPNCPEAIAFFADTLQVKRFARLGTGVEVKAVLEQDIAEYELKKQAFESSRELLLARLDKHSADAEKVAMVQQELNLIMTATHYRVRSLAPTIDNLSILTAKLDKGVNEVRRLAEYLDNINSVQNLYSIGLFPPSPHGLSPMKPHYANNNRMKNI